MMLLERAIYENIKFSSPGITKVHTNFILPEITVIKELAGDSGIYFIQDKDGFIKIV